MDTKTCAILNSRDPELDGLDPTTFYLTRALFDLEA